MKDQIKFECPLDCLPAVGEVFSGQYALPSSCSLSGVPTILDIGANCGAFTIWARMTCQGCRVFAYEPQPDIFEFLSRNLSGIPNTTPIHAGVGDPAATVFARGRHSRLCTSQYDIGEQGADAFTASVIAPETLPEADIVKIDAEGAEGYILEHMIYTPKALMLEWHGDKNRRRCDDALAGRMKLVSSRLLSLETGVNIYIKP